MEIWDSRQNTKERIRSRIIKRAAEMWDFQELELDSFDPLVSMLIGAFAVEFEKVYSEITTVNSRIVEQLANIMVPDVLDIPKPSFGIVLARSTEPEHYVSAESQFVIKKQEAPTGVGSVKTEMVDVFFSPVNKFKVVDGAVKYLSNGASLFKITDGIKKTQISSTEKDGSTERNCLWIGVETSHGPYVLNDVSFFFSWPVESEKEINGEYLSASKWFINGVEVEINGGIKVAEIPDSNNELSEEFDTMKRFEGNVLSYYQTSFINIRLPQELLIKKPFLEKYPVEFQEIFPQQDLSPIKENLTWVKVIFPDAISADSLAGVTCAINAFPVINRKLNKLNWRLKQNMNIVPLECIDEFLAIRTLYNSRNDVYKQLPLVNITEVKAKTYTVRDHGTTRFDGRDAKQLLQYLLELLRDESAAFAASGDDFLFNNIRELNQKIAQLEQKLDKTPNHASAIPCLYVKSESSSENIFVEYWTTRGSFANKIPLGSKLSAYEGSGVKNGEVVLLTTTDSGNDRPRAAEKVLLFKRTVLNRNRIVTLEDIRVACLNELGQKVKRVVVAKGLMVGEGPASGFTKCITVTLFPATPNPLTKQEWVNVQTQLRLVLESQSSLLIPFQILIEL